MPRSACEGASGPSPIYRNSRSTSDGGKNTGEVSDGLRRCPASESPAERRRLARRRLPAAACSRAGAGARSPLRALGLRTCRGLLLRLDLRPSAVTPVAASRKEAGGGGECALSVLPRGREAREMTAGSRALSHHMACLCFRECSRAACAAISSGVRARAPLALSPARSATCLGLDTPPGAAGVAALTAVIRLCALNACAALSVPVSRYTRPDPAGRVTMPSWCNVCSVRQVSTSKDVVWTTLLRLHSARRLVRHETSTHSPANATRPRLILPQIAQGVTWHGETHHCKDLRCCSRRCMMALLCREVLPPNTSASLSPMTTIVFLYLFSNHYTRECIHTCQRERTCGSSQSAL